MSLTTFQWILAMTLINGFLAFAGVFSFLISKRELNKILLFLVAFATGSLLGGAFFHLIPESYLKIHFYVLISLIFFGFFLFWLIEKFLFWHHCHEGKCEHVYNYLLLYGDGMHNFIDGVLIASSFLVSIKLGIITSFIIMIHELPQEVGNFGVLVFGGFSRKKALIYSFFTQLTSVLGGILGFFIFSIKEYAVYLLPFAAGGFLYIAVIDLIPEIFKEKSKIKIIINLIAIVLGLLLLLSARLFIG